MSQERAAIVRRCRRSLSTYQPCARYPLEPAANFCSLRSELWGWGHVVDDADRPGGDVHAADVCLRRQNPTGGGRTAGDRRASRRPGLGRRLLRVIGRRSAFGTDGLWQLRYPLWRAPHEPGGAGTAWRRDGGGSRGWAFGFWRIGGHWRGRWRGFDADQL